MSLQQAIAKALQKEVRKGLLTVDQANQLLENPGKNKFGVAPVEERTLDGIVFDSKAEMDRYAELVLLERAREITNLEIHPRFILQEFSQTKLRPIIYEADFQYYDVKEKKIIVEDVKGFETPIYKMKRKMFSEKFPHFSFIEIKRQKSSKWQFRAKRR